MSEGNADGCGNQDDDDVGEVVRRWFQAEIPLAVRRLVAIALARWRLAYQARRCYALYRWALS